MAKAPIGDPKLRYRKEVEIYASRGEISNIGRKILDTQRQNLGLLPEEVAAIETEVLKPYREYQQKLQEYKQAFIDALRHEETLSDSTRNELRHYKEVLGLRNQDIDPIETKIISQKKIPPKEFITRNLGLKDNLNFGNIALIKNKLLLGLTVLIFGLAGVQIIYSQITSINPRYIQLQKLLSERKWKEADDETAQKMWEVAGRQQERSLREEDFEKFPCEDLQTIDNLWVKYSKEYFGLSVQKHIWQSPEVNSDFDKFIARVGWGMRQDNTNTIIFKGLNLLSFDLTVPKGQLPVAVTYDGGNVITRQK
ncbi:MAG: GUN4 domain-containing protein, partial [Nostoc sp.]